MESKKIHEQLVMEHVENARRQVDLICLYLDEMPDEIPQDVLDSWYPVRELVRRMDEALRPAMDVDVTNVTYGASSHFISGAFPVLPACFQAFGQVAIAYESAGLPGWTLQPWVNALDSQVEQMRMMCELRVLTRDWMIGKVTKEAYRKRQDELWEKLGM